MNCGASRDMKMRKILQHNSMNSIINHDLMNYEIYLPLEITFNIKMFYVKKIIFVSNGN